MISSKLGTKGVQTCLFVPVVLTFVFLFGSASAEIKLTDNLSLSGFLDMSSVITDDGNATAATLSFDQAELDFHFNYGSVTGRVDIDNIAGPGGGVGVEQGFVTYTFPEDIMSGLSITAGRFLSTLGFETAEPTGLYQFSFSEGIPYPGYQNGVAVALNPDEKFGIYAALLSGVWDVTDTDVKAPGFEAQVSVVPVEQVTAKVGFAFEDSATDPDETQSELNAWVSFADGPLTVAGEIDVLTNWTSPDTGILRDNGIHYLGMANVSLADVISAPIGLTVRFSGIKLDEEDASTEITVSPSYVPTDNWTLLGEFKRRIDAEETIVAFESLFTF
jgi:hypothetical protein